MPLSRSIPISLAIACVGLAAILGGVYLMQDRLIYPRTPAAAAPAGWSLTDLGNGAKGWWSPPKAGGRTIVFFHGNATNVAGVVQATKAYRKLGYGILAPEYPGYAGVPGTPDEASINAVADQAMRWLARNGIPADDTIVYGNSIGSGPAIHAALHPHSSLVIVSGVSSFEEVARFHHGVLGGLVRDKWMNGDAIAKIKGHKIIVHGLTDDVVPVEQGEKLAKRTGVPLIWVPGGHEIAFDEGLQASIETSLRRNAARGG